MTKQELKSQLSELENDIYQGNIWQQDELKVAKRKIRKLKKAIIALLPPLVPGGSIGLYDFITHLNVKGTKDKPKKKFIEDHSYKYSESEMEIVLELIGDEYGVYNWFNKMYSPTDVKRIKGETIKEECKSNNIYDVMCTPQTTDFRDEFQIKLSYHDEPITVFKEYTKNTTLSQSDVRAFM